MPREIIVNWTTVNGAGKKSVMFCREAGAIATQRSALQTFLTAVKASLTTVTSYSIATSGRDLDDATGTLTGAWAEGTAHTGSGASATQPVADATQILFQWHTGEIVRGRFSRGRTFVPGLPVGQLLNGNLTGAQVTGLTTVANALAASGMQLVVWSRPLKDPITHVIIDPGQANAVDSATVWSEMAVLRRRRG